MPESANEFDRATNSLRSAHHLGLLDRPQGMGSIETALSPERFRELVEVIRPELHRYCARMTGSVTDGEDIVQDVLVRAHASMMELKQVSQARSWLFRIAHNRAIDHTRGYGHRMSEPLDAIEGRPEERDTEIAADERLVRQEILRGAIDRFSALPPLQRSCVILKDVLDHSLEDIASLLDLSVSAVQAALHRGRLRLQRLLQEQRDELEPARQISPSLARYAALFGAHDWDGVRAMLAEDVRLDIVSRLQRTGRSEVSNYFTNYARIPGLRLVPGWLARREVLGVFGEGEEAAPNYFIEVSFANDQVVAIRDFRHVSYIARDARFEAA